LPRHSIYSFSQLWLLSLDTDVFYRTFGWPVPKAGLSFGLIMIAASVSGTLWGGWYADRLLNKGVMNGRVRIGVIAGIVSLSSCFIPLVGNPDLVLFLLAIPLFFLAAPMGASTTAIHELMPNQVRALSSAIFLFLSTSLAWDLVQPLLPFSMIMFLPTKTPFVFRWRRCLRSAGCSHFCFTG
jgi:MFS family permease